MVSERLSAILDSAMQSGTPLDRFIDRLKEERNLGYYDSYPADDLFKIVIKWAEKYRSGEA